MQRRAFLGSILGGAAAATAFSLSRWSGGAASRSGVSPLFRYDPDTVFLTWEGDPTTTMTVQWVAPKTLENTNVYYRSLASPAVREQQTFRKPYPGTELSVYRSNLAGLIPGTEYHFQIGMSSTAYRFRTMPAKATNTIQFVSGGDSGINEHAIANNRLAAQQDPFFVLIGGDLAYDNGRSPATFTRFLQNYSSNMIDSQGRMIPMLSCIGNHDVNGGYNCKRSHAPQYLSLFDGLFKERTFGTVDFGDYLSVVLLDTNHIAPVAGEQTAWLEKILSERQDRPHLIVANHVPAYPSYRPMHGVDGNETGTGEDQRRLWTPLFERYKVDVVLEHHDHTFKRTFPLTNGHKDKNGVVYLGDGSWGKIRPPRSPQERPYLAAVAEAYHLTVHRLEGERQFHVALEDTGRVADVCMTKGKRPSRRG